jgi:CRISPR-associated protein Cas2
MEEKKMLLVSYDISDDKVRTKFSKFLSKFGFRLQYSVFEIHNSERVLRNLQTEIKNTYVDHFTEEDSIIIFELTETCKKTCYGYAKHENEDLLFVT